VSEGVLEVTAVYKDSRKQPKNMLAAMVHKNSRYCSVARDNYFLVNDNVSLYMLCPSSGQSTEDNKNQEKDCVYSIIV
jgi:hypothetical protein